MFHLILGRFFSGLVYMLNSLLQHGFWQLLLVTCTILGAFGGFPQPPKAFVALTQYQVVQWALVFVLVYQGGSGQDPVLAGAATALTLVLYKAVRAIESNDEGELLL
jgi:hypothetical protein